MAAQKSGKAPKKSGTDWRWILTIFVITVCISAVMSLISTNLLANATLGVSFVILICIIAILLFFICLGILFDIIGVAVTSADEKPFHSMASRKVPEAGEALKLIRNAGRVSSFCNDVIGDICGVISGSASATIAVRVWSMHPGMQELAVTLSMSALAAGLTVGGKACGKSFAIGSSTTVVRTAATILHFFHTIPEKLRPKRKR